MSDETQALCFFAGANSIFVGDTLLTADNPGEDSDAGSVRQARPRGRSSSTRAARCEASRTMLRNAASHERALEALARRGRLPGARRRARGVDFSSNDYLGLAASRRAEGGGARLRSRAACRSAPAARGCCAAITAEHEALEAEAAAFFGAESALFFGSGFAANIALFSTLPQRGDLIVHDELIHASAHDGMRARQGRARRGPRTTMPQRVRGRHHGAGARRAAPAGRGSRSKASTPWTATARRSPISLAIADRHDGVLLIDEAHATGVLGPDGRGLGARSRRARQRHHAAHLRQGARRDGRAASARPRSMRDFLVNRAPRLHLLDRALAADGRRRARGARASAATSRSAATALHALVAYAGRSSRERCGVAAIGLADPAGHRRRRRARRCALAAAHAGARLRRARHPPADRARRHRAAAHLAHAQRRRGDSRRAWPRRSPRS